MKVKSLSRIRLLATPCTAAYQAPPSMGFSRQEYWSGVPLPSPSVNLEAHISGNSPTDDLPDNSIIMCQVSHPWRALLLNVLAAFCFLPIPCYHSGSCNHSHTPGPSQQDLHGLMFKAPFAHPLSAYSLLTTISLPKSYQPNFTKINHTGFPPINSPSLCSGPCHYFHFSSGSFMSSLYPPTFKNECSRAHPVPPLSPPPRPSSFTHANNSEFLSQSRLLPPAPTHFPPQ